MAGLIDLVRKGKYRKDENIVFLHTGGSAGLFAYKKTFTAWSKICPELDLEWFVIQPVHAVKSCNTVSFIKCWGSQNLCSRNIVLYLHKTSRNVQGESILRCAVPSGLFACRSGTDNNYVVMMNFLHLFPFIVLDIEKDCSWKVLISLSIQALSLVQS